MVFESAATGGIIRDRGGLIEPRRFCGSVQHNLGRFIFPNMHIVQPSTVGVNFFSQPLISSEIYLCCPPISLFLTSYQKLIQAPGITSWLLVPEWLAASFWPVLFPVASCVMKLYRFKTSFCFANTAQIHIFTKTPSFSMLHC
jgi:hypothetical protein